MKLLFDENISYRIVKKLKHLLPDCIHVSQTALKLQNADRRIWEYAKLNQYLIVTFDEDFKDLVDLYSFPPKVILFRTGNSSTNFVADILERKLPAIVDFQVSQTQGLLEIF